MHEILNGRNPKGDARLLKDLGIEDEAARLQAHANPGPTIRQRLIAAIVAPAGAAGPAATASRAARGAGGGVEGDALAHAAGPGRDPAEVPGRRWGARADGVDQFPPTMEAAPARSSSSFMATRPEMRKGSSRACSE